MTRISSNSASSLGGSLKPSFGSVTLCIDSMTLTASSMTLAIDSMMSVSDVACSQSGRPIASGNESMTLVIDSFPLAFQLTCFQRYAGYLATPHSLTHAQSITIPQCPGGGVGYINRAAAAGSRLEGLYSCCHICQQRLSPTISDSRKLQPRLNYLPITPTVFIQVVARVGQRVTGDPSGEGRSRVRLSNRRGVRLEHRPF
jgi:hypothetical protein